MKKFEYTAQIANEAWSSCLVDWLNEMGDDGWELVAVRGVDAKATYYFKREAGGKQTEAKEKPCACDCEEPVLWGLWSPTTNRWLAPHNDAYEVFHTAHRRVAEAVLNNLKLRFAPGSKEDADGWEWEVRQIGGNA